MNDLKPCPFCGKEVTLRSSSRSYSFIFSHKGLRNCPFFQFEIMWTTAKTLKEAIELWNRRAVDACARYFDVREWDDALINKWAYEHIINDCAYEIGKAALNNSWWQVEKSCLFGDVSPAGNVRLVIRTQIVDNSDGNPLPQNLNEMEGR